MTKITNTTSTTPIRSTTTPTTTTTTTTSTVTTTSTTKHDWCNLDSYEIAVQQRLNSSKDIIVVAKICKNTYKKAKSVCENICGRVYLPSTLKENDEVELVFLRHLNNFGLGLWLRMTYDETAGTWYDPDNKEDLTFLNFDQFDQFQDWTKNLNCESTKEHHAVMAYDGEWWSRDGVNIYSPYVLCELT